MMEVELKTQFETVVVLQMTLAQAENLYSMCANESAYWIIAKELADLLKVKVAGYAKEPEVTKAYVEKTLGPIMTNRDTRSNQRIVREAIDSWHMYDEPAEVGPKLEEKIIKALINAGRMNLKIKKE